jgi:hypothetical protein
MDRNEAVPATEKKAEPDAREPSSLKVRSAVRGNAHGLVKR